MTSPVPSWIAWPIIFVMLATSIVRFTLLNTNQVDRLANHAIAFGTLGMILREPLAQRTVAELPSPFGDVLLVQQLSFCCIVMIVQSIYGMAKVWGGADANTARARQRIYYFIGLVLSCIIIIAGTPSRQADMLIDEYLGWPAVIVWLAFYAPILVAAILILRVFGREFRQPDTTTRERALYVVTLLIAVGLLLDAVLSPLVTIGEVLSGQASKDPKMEVKAWTFFISVATAQIVGLVPVISALRFRFGQDRISRNARQVEVLWRDLTEQFQDVRREIDPENRDPAWLLHRRVIEIYDALLRLSRWNTNHNGAFTEVHSDGAPVSKAAAEIALAYAAKASGQDPTNKYELLSLVTSRPESQDLTAASDQLLVVAKEWESARERYSRIVY